MRSTNGGKNIRSNNPDWYLLAEYALGEMLPDNGKEYDVTAGFLFQPLKELGVPPELIRKIVLTLTGSAQKAGMSVKQKRLERPGRIRVFCQKKVIDNANAVKTSRPDHAEPMMEPVPIQDPSSTILGGGWGYFIIERSAGSADSPKRNRPLFDLYLYKEGG